MRLIDADALPKYTGYALSADEVAKAVESAPTIDAVQVVRCKDCSHTNARSKDGEYWHCGMFNLWMNEDFYCADGEAKE